MAKTKAKARAAEGERHARRLDPDATNRTLIIGVVVAVVLAAIGFIAFGYYQTEIRPLGKTVMRVGDVEVSLGHLQRRMQNAVDSGTPLTQENLLNLPDGMLDQLEFEATLLSSVGELGIEVTDEDIDAEIRERGNLDDDVSARAFAEEYRRQVDESGLHEGEYRQMVAAQVAGDRALDYFVFVAPQAEAQVRWRWVVAESEEDALAAVERLDAGEAFDDVANDLGLEGTRPIDEETRQREREEEAEQEGEPPPQEPEEEWAPRGTFPGDAIEDFLFEDAQVGDRSGVLSTASFFYVVELLERDDERPLEPGQRQVVGSRELTAWVEALELDIERNLSQEDAVRVINDLDINS